MKIQRNKARLKQTTIGHKVFNISEEVKLTNGKIVTIQQAMYAIQDDNVKQLFHGVE